MGIFGLFEKIGNGIIGMFLKFFFVLIIILIILGLVIGIGIHWKFFLGFLIGALFSPYLYNFLEENLELGLPEFFFWNYGDVAEAFFVNEGSIDEIQNNCLQKTKAARFELENMDKRYINLKAAFEDLKAKKDIKEMIVGTESKKYSSSRMRKAILMNIGDPEWVAEMKEIKTNIDWNKYM
jgi:hypothetical protein